MNGAIDESASWPLRAWTLGVAGVLIGWAAHHLSIGMAGFFGSYAQGQKDPGALALATATFLITAGIAFAITWERRRPFWALAFAGSTGLVVASVIAWNGGPSAWQAANGWRLLCALVAVGIASPFFQVARDLWELGNARHFPYPALHRDAWTNVVLLGLAFLFVLLVWALAWLLAGLFGLAGLHFLSKLLERDGAFLVVSGGALGTGLGLLRDRVAILASLQRVVVLIFAVLSPVLAVGFGVFMLSLPFTGLAPLWQATKLTTPILITCCLVSITLVNAVIADRDEDASVHPVFRWAARVLGVVLTPFAAITIMSTALRIEQHGLTPDRLWAIVFDAICSAYAIAYLFLLVRHRFGSRWSADVRQANVRLAAGLCVPALLLSTPLLGFGAISARSQLARLKSGQVSALQFDWLAMRFDFGPSGQAMLRRLSTDRDPAIRANALSALAATDRFSAMTSGNQGAGLPLLPRLRAPAGQAGLPPGLTDLIAKTGTCRGDQRCFVMIDPAQTFAIAVYEGCPAASGRCAGNTSKAARFVAAQSGWAFDQDIFLPDRNSDPDKQRWRAAFDRGSIGVGTVVRHRLIIAGQPIGEPFP